MPGSRDETTRKKREEYLAVGLLEYWIVDPKLRQVTVLVRVEGAGGPAWDERVFRDDVEAIESPPPAGLPGDGRRTLGRCRAGMTDEA